MLLLSMMNWLNLRTFRMTQSKYTHTYIHIYKITSVRCFLLWWPCSLLHSVIAFRKSNKIGFFIKVIPQKEEDTDVVVSFKIRHDFRNLAAPVRPSEEGVEPTAEAIWLMHHVELRLGPLAPWTAVLWTNLCKSGIHSMNSDPAYWYVRSTWLGMKLLPLFLSFFFFFKLLSSNVLHNSDYMVALFIYLWLSSSCLTLLLIFLFLKLRNAVKMTMDYISPSLSSCSAF